MLRRMWVLFIGIIVIVAVGCATAPHPLLRALAPKNMERELTEKATIAFKLNANAKLPFVPPSHVTMDWRGEQLFVKIHQPFNTAEIMRLYQEELTKRGYKNVQVVSVEGEKR